VVDIGLTGTSACHVNLALSDKDMSDTCEAARGVQQSHGHGRIDWRLPRSGVDVAVQSRYVERPRLHESAVSQLGEP
jgi:hypothetical protein